MPTVTDQERVKNALAHYAAAKRLNPRASTEDIGPAIGIPGSTLRRWVREHGRSALAMQDEISVSPPPPADESLQELIARKKLGMQRAQAHEEWAKLIPVRVKSDGPIGLFLVGDPHVDDDHCDIEQLEHDLTAVGRTKGMFAGHIGDLTNNWVGRLKALYANQSTKFSDGVKLTEWMLGLAPNLFVVGGNHDCHDAQTEALTRRGWVRGADIRDDDEVLTLNAETGRAEWNPILARVSKHVDTELISIESQSISALVTPGHRVLHRVRHSSTRGWSADLSYCKASELPSRFALPTNADEGAPGCGLTDDQIRLAGWVLTDGSLGSDGRVSIWQSKDGAEIERVLDGCGLAYTMYTRHREIAEVCGRALVSQPLPQREYRLLGAAARAARAVVPAKGALPAWAGATTRKQFDVLLDAMVAGDGTWDGADPASKTVAVLHGDRSFLGDVQALAVRRGWTARLSVARGKDYRLNLCRRKELQLERGQTVTRRRYTGAVWCLTVPNSNFMVRRNGAAHFSGNCWEKGMDILRFIVAQGSPMQAHGARLGLTWPDGSQIRVHARHDFPGRSQFSDTHGMKRELLFGRKDHVLVAGHTHVDEGRVEPSIDGDVHWLFRVSGYKVIDDFAKEKGFRPKRLAPGVSLILNPRARVPAEVVKPFWDVETAADYLRFLRKRL